MRKLVILTILAIGIRLPALVQELPPFLFCDEGMFFGEVQRLLQTGGWIPDDFRSGGVNVYPVLVLARFFRLFAPLFASETSVLLFGRFLLVVTVGSCGVIATGALAKLVSGSEKLGLLAAVLFAASPGLRAFGRYWYPDHYLYAITAVFLFALVRDHQLKSLKSAVFTGVAFGFAVSTKYTAMTLILPAACLYASDLINVLRERDTRGHMKKVFQRAIVFAAASVITFIAFNPGVIWRRKEFVRDWKFNLNNYDRPSNGIGGIFFYGDQLALRSLGVVAFLFAIIGALHLVKVNKAVAISLLSFPAALVFTLGRSGLAINRNISSAIPIIAVLAAVGCGKCIQMVAKPTAEHRVLRTGVVLSFLLFQPIVETGTALIHDFSPDSRKIAQPWLDAYLPANATVGVNEFCSGPPPIGRKDLSIVSDPMMQNSLDFYVINSYWNSPFVDSYKHIGEQKYFHFYRFNDVEIRGYLNSRPNLAAKVPSGYQIEHVFSSNGPDIIVLKRTS